MAGSVLEGADLRDADLGWADLAGAKLRDARLEGARFSGADLQGAVFEPTSMPEIRGIAAARNLQLLTFNQNPDAVYQLRKRFQDGGFLVQKRQITCALNRRQAELDPFVERWIRKLAFEKTCQYGMNPMRPLGLTVLLWLVFSIVYILFMHLRGRNSIYLVVRREREGRKSEIRVLVRPRWVAPVSRWKYAIHIAREEGRIFRVAFCFSLMSALNFTFWSVNPGGWLRLLATREYGFEPRRWVRAMAGFQSLVSFCLIALSVLTYWDLLFQW
jgi:hypothetical protein